MKAVVLYASKHGCTEKCAHLLGKRLGNVDVVDLNREPSISLEEYDTVLIGSSVYAGKINKAASQFCTTNLATLKQKRIGLFVCCGQSEKAMEQLEAGFPKELVQVAVAKGYFGYDFTKLNFFERMVVKAVGAPEGKSEIRNAAIESFAQSFSQGA